MVQDCGCGEFLRGPEVKIGVGWVGRKLKPVMFTVVDDGDAVVEGCIILGKADDLEKRAKIIGPETFGVGVNDPKFLWKKALIPYRISEEFLEPERVHDAIAHWKAHTGMDFVERSAANAHLYPDFVTFKTGSGCSSSVGCQGGEQFIKLGPSCGTGNVIHEIGHAAGLFHEQSRADRDQYVDVSLENVDPLYRHNFTQHIKDGQDIGQYDLGSIMHYPKDAFTQNGKDTIRAKNGAPIGQREKLSPGDIASIAALYAGQQ